MHFSLEPQRISIHSAVGKNNNFSTGSGDNFSALTFPQKKIPHSTEAVDKNQDIKSLIKNMKIQDMRYKIQDTRYKISVIIACILVDYREELILAVISRMLFCILVSPFFREAVILSTA